MKVLILINVVLACAAISQSLPTDSPNNTPSPRKLHIFDNIKAASLNLASVASHQISNGLNRTTNLVNTMSDVLTLALNTTNKLSNIDRKHFLGGKLSNESSIFLNTTSTVVANILKAKFNRLNGLIAMKTNITNKMLQISSNFMNKTGQLFTKLTNTSSPPFLPHRKWNTAQNILNKSIDLANVTGQSLANVINATSVLLTKYVDDHTHFVTELLNSTVNILNVTTNSLGSLLNTTNHLILDVIHSKSNTSALILNQTANLLTASSKTVHSLLNATTLLISNAASYKWNVGGHNFTLVGLNATHNALKSVFHSTDTLLKDVISVKKSISSRLITTTRAFFNASIQIKASLFNKTLDVTKHVIASKLHATIEKFTSHLGDSAAPNVSDGRPLAHVETTTQTIAEIATADNNGVLTDNTEISNENTKNSTEKDETSNNEVSGDIETSSASVDDEHTLSKSLENSIANRIITPKTLHNSTTTGASADQTSGAA